MESVKEMESIKEMPKSWRMARALMHDVTQETRYTDGRKRRRAPGSRFFLTVGLQEQEQIMLIEWYIVMVGIKA